jgi:hypothetical protein
MNSPPNNAMKSAASDMAQRRGSTDAQGSTYATSPIC